MTMRIGVVGAGAIGCVVGGLLTRTGHDVMLIDQWPEHVETLKRQGLRLSGTCGDRVIPVTALHGYVVTEGRKAGVATPINEAVVDLYRCHGVGALKPDPRTLEPLLKLVP